MREAGWRSWECRSPGRRVRCGFGGSQAPPQPSLMGYGKQFGFSPEYNKQPLKCVTQRGTGSDSHLKCNSGCCMENAPKTRGEVRRLEPGQASSIESDFAIQGAGGNVGRLEGGLWASRSRGQGCCSTATVPPFPQNDLTQNANRADIEILGLE